jgi:predicted PurR-regulated permease PerM
MMTMRTPDQTNGPATAPPAAPARRGGAPPRPAGRGGTPLGDFARRAVVAVLVAALLLALAYLCWRGLHVLLQVFAGVLFAVFLSALAGWLSERARLRYGWALAVVVLALLAVAGGLGWLLANRLALQTQEFSQRVPESLERVRGYLGERPWGRVLLEHEDNARDVLAQLGQALNVGGILSGVTAFVVTALIIFFVGLFGAAEPGLYRGGVLHLVPPPQRPRAAEALDALVFNLRWWLVGQVFLMVAVAVTTAAGLWLIGVPLALALGVLAGVLELVPYVGPWISAVPAVLVALTVSPGCVLAVLALYLALHLLEGYVLVPLVQRRAVHLPPALTVAAQALLAELLGVMGLFVAAPLTLCAVVLLKMLYVEDTLGDDAVDVPGEPGNEEKQAAAEAAGITDNVERAQRAFGG